MSKKDGGAALPGREMHGFYETRPTPGLSLRDLFAGVALHAVLVCPLGDEEVDINEVALSAYAFADAMIAARESANA